MSREAHVRFCESVAVKFRCATRPPMERVFRSFKSEWMPPEGYRTFAEAKKDIGHYLMDYYNWYRPH